MSGILQEAWTAAGAWNPSHAATAHLHQTKNRKEVSYIMSSPREIWHPYIRNLLSHYPKNKARENEAIEQAIEQFSPEKKELFQKLYYERLFKISEVEEYYNISFETAKKWNRELFYRIAGFLNLI